MHLGHHAERDRDVRGGSWPEIRDWKTLTRSFADVSIYDETTLNLSGMGAAEMLEAEIVSPGYFRLRLRPGGSLEAAQADVNPTEALKFE